MSPPFVKYLWYPCKFLRLLPKKVTMAFRCRQEALWFYGILTAFVIYEALMFAYELFYRQTFLQLNKVQKVLKLLL